MPTARSQILAVRAYEWVEAMMSAQRYYVATNEAHMMVDALSADDAARRFAESVGVKGVVNKETLFDCVEATGGWASVEVAIQKVHES